MSIRTSPDGEERGTCRYTFALSHCPGLRRLPDVRCGLLVHLKQASVFVFGIAVVALWLGVASSMHGGRFQGANPSPCTVGAMRSRCARSSFVCAACAKRWCPKKAPPD